MLTRRSFTVLASLAGLGALVAPAALSRVVRRLRIGSTDAHEPMLDRIERLVGRLDRGELSPEAFLREVQARFDETDLPAELQDHLTAAPPGNAILAVWSASEANRTRALMLFLLPPASAVPAHAHHSVASAQCVVRGNLWVRQYERVRRLDPLTLALRPVSDRRFAAGETFLTTERLANVHWFGAEAEAAVVVNYSLNGGFGNTFDAPDSRPVGRYFVDPTTRDRIDDLIAAPELESDEAHARFASHALSDFANPLRTG